MTAFLKPPNRPFSQDDEGIDITHGDAGGVITLRISCFFSGYVIARWW